MKVFKEIGSKDRFVEMFQNVNKMKLTEAFGQTLNPQSVLEQAFGELKSGVLKITNTSTQTNDNESFVEIMGTDKQGNNITFTFKALVQEGEQDGVFDVTDVAVEQFSFDSAMSEESVEMQGDTLKQFNMQHKNELFEIVDEYIDVETEETIDTLYEDAVKLIDKVPYKKGSEEMQTHKAYADEKPTNPDVRVKADELDKFVNEEYPEQLGKEFKPKSETEYSKVAKTKKKHKSKKVEIKETYNVIDSDYNRQFFNEFIGKSFDKPIPYAQVKVIKESFEVGSEEEIEIDSPEIPADKKAKAAEKTARGDIYRHYREVGKEKENPDDRFGTQTLPYDTDFKLEEEERPEGEMDDANDPANFDINQNVSAPDDGMSLEPENDEVSQLTQNKNEIVQHAKEIVKLAQQTGDDEGEHEATETPEEDKEMEDELLGYKPMNVGDYAGAPLDEMATGNKTKSFKLGEWAVGGIIKVDIIKNSGVQGGEVAISALDWTTKKPVQGTRFVATNTNAIDNYLHELTSSYYAGKIMEWIQANTGVSSRPNYFSNHNW